MLTACAETQFGAHVAKNIDRDTQSQGMYMLGNPYLIMGLQYQPQENFNYVETGSRPGTARDFTPKTANGENTTRTN